MFNLLTKRTFHSQIINVQRNISAKTAAVAAKQSSTSNNSNEELTTATIDPKTNIATLTMNRLPANALSFELMTALKDAVHELERQKVSGIIVTSASDRIFCAGLDLKQVYKADVERLAEMWRALQDMWQAIFATPLPTAALINGHALAGGCVISLACDYRVALPKFTIGMNETRVGIAVPSWVQDNYLNVINSRRIAEADLIEGKSYKSQGALTVGLVDDVVDTREQALEKCTGFLRSYEGPTRLAKAQTKLSFRADILKDFEQNRQQDVDLFIKGISRPEVQEFLGDYLQSLNERRGSKKA